MGLIICVYRPSDSLLLSFPSPWQPQGSVSSKRRSDVSRAPFILTDEISRRQKRTKGDEAIKERWLADVRAPAETGGSAPDNGKHSL